MKRLWHLTLSLIALTLTPARAVPRGWQLSATTQEHYQVSLDSQAHGGKASACIASQGLPPARAHAVLGQKIHARRYRGQRLRMTAAVRTREVQGWAGMWMRVDPLQGPSLEFDNMQDRPITGTTEWTSYSIELTVPPESEYIFFGVLLNGRGQVWFDSVRLEAVGAALPADKLRRRLRGELEPFNLDFEQPQ